MKRAVFGICLLTGLSVPHAGWGSEGPWTLQPGAHKLDVGALSYRYTRYDAGVAATALDTDIIGMELVGVWTYGLFDGFELQARAPYESVRVGDPRSPVCREAPRQGWCAPTAGLGDIALQVKTRLIDEVHAAPISVSGIWGMRTGEAYSATRGRLTTLGPGQTDFGGALTIGRTDVLGAGWYRASGSLGYWYRVPHVTAPEKVPADELQYDLHAALAPVPLLSLGPAMCGFTRLGGVDVAAADLSHVNGLASLNAAQLQAGGKLGLHAPGSRGTVTLAVLRTVAARNSPDDTVMIGLGLGWLLQPSAQATIALPELLPPEG